MKWISVKDKIPTPDITSIILLYHPDHTMCIAGFVGEKFCHDNEYCRHPDDNFRAWMPITPPENI